MTDTKANGNEIPENERTQDENDLAAEFAALGKKFAEALNTAWNSEERHQLQEDLKKEMNQFTKEVDKAIKKARESEAGQKVQQGVQRAASDVKTGKVSDDVRRGMVTALRGFSTALDRMAASFKPAEEEDAPQE